MTKFKRTTFVEFTIANGEKQARVFMGAATTVLFYLADLLEVPVKDIDVKWCGEYKQPNNANGRRSILYATREDFKEFKPKKFLDGTQKTLNDCLIYNTARRVAEYNAGRGIA